MTVVGQRLRQSFAAHGMHRDAVRKAVALVGTGCVQIEPGQKRFMALRNDMHGGVGQNLAHGFDGAFSEPSLGGEKRQHFGQHFFGRVNAASRQKIVKPPDFPGVCVPRTDQGDPVKRIGENPLTRLSWGRRRCNDRAGSRRRPEPGADFVGDIGPDFADSSARGGFLAVQTQAPDQEPAEHTVRQTDRARALWLRDRLRFPA